jgi:transcriptional regulator with XRE-family HTH domain
MLSMKLTTNLQVLMKDKRISLIELSKEVDIPSSTIHGWLNGANPRNIAELKRVANYFHISIDELCFGEKVVHSDQVVVGKIGDVELILRKSQNKN